MLRTSGAFFSLANPEAQRPLRLRSEMELHLGPRYAGLFLFIMADSAPTHCGLPLGLVWLRPHMLMIRFQRIGRTNDPAFRISLLEKHRAAKSGSVIEQLGSYNPKTKAFSVDEARVKELIGNGAQPTDTVRNLFIAKGIIEGKKVNALPKKTAPKKEEEPAAGAAAAPAAEPTEAEVAADAAPAEDVPAEEPKTDETLVA